MDLLHVLWTGEIGGKERAVYQLVRNQIKMSRFRPSVAFGQARGPYVDLFRELGCTVVDLGLRRGLDLPRIPAVHAKLQRFQLHHFHSAEPTIMVASARCAKSRRYYTHRGGIPSFSLGQRLKYATLGLLFRSSFDGLSANTRHATLAGSRLTGIPQNRWAVTYNGMDFSLLSPSPDSPQIPDRYDIPVGRRVIVGTSANLRALKRIDLLLTACSKLTDTNFHLVIVGDGPERRSLEEQTKSIGIQERVSFVGMHRHIGDFLAHMDIFVLPSGPQESFGNSVIEAMAVGVPPIVFSDGGGLTEHIQDGNTGYVVDSVNHLASRIRYLIENQALRSEVGDNAARYVRDRYSLDSMTIAYERFYETHGAHP